MTTFSAASRISTSRNAEAGIRAFDIGRDLRPVAKLIGEAFANELDPRGSAALREMRAMSHIGGLLKVLNRSTGEFNDVFSGFVWVDQDEVVGNITVQKGDSYGNRWQIANVAVAPKHRGHGIGRRLVQRALEHIQSQGGKHAVLQVEASNRVARGLYESMGFETLGGRTEMSIARIPKSERLNALMESATSSTATTDATVLSFYASQWQRLYDLATSQQGSRDRWWRPVRRVSFQVTFEQRLAELFWQILGRRDVWRRRIGGTNRFEAATILTAYRWRGVHDIQLWVRPERQGRLEEPLVQWILAKLEDYPRWPVLVKLDTEQTAAIRVFERYGFEHQHTLLTMRREA